MDALRCVQPVDRQWPGDLVGNTVLSRRQIEPKLAAEKVIRAQIAQNQIGVGHGWRRAAAAIANGSGIGAGACRPDLQHAAFIDDGDATAARADSANIEHGKRHCVAAHRSFRGETHLAVLDERNVEARAAHVHGDEILITGSRSAENTRHRPARRSRQKRATGKARRHFGRHHAAVGLHDQQSAVKPGALQARRQAFEITGQNRSDVGVKRGGAVPLIGAQLRQYLGRQ